MAKTKEFQVTAGKLGARLRGDSKRALGAIRRGLVRAAVVGEAIVAEATPVDTANTRNAWRVRLTRDGADLINDSPTAVFLEEGTRPHRPPLLPLVRWAMRKKGLGGSTTITRLEDAPDEAVGMAVGIANKIERKGTRPVHMVRSNLTRLTQIARRNVEAELERENDRGGNDGS